MQGRPRPCPPLPSGLHPLTTWPSAVCLSSPLGREPRASSAGRGDSRAVDLGTQNVEPGSPVPQTEPLTPAESTVSLDCAWGQGGDRNGGGAGRSVRRAFSFRSRSETKVSLPGFRSFRAPGSQPQDHSHSTPLLPSASTLNASLGASRGESSVRPPPPSNQSRESRCRSVWVRVRDTSTSHDRAGLPGPS